MAQRAAMTAVLALVLCLLGLAVASKTEVNKFEVASGANPIRKVVTMMQKMSEQIEKEAEEEKQLYDKFMCHCKTELADFEKGRDEFEAAVPKLQADAATATAQIAQLSQEIEAQKADQKQAVDDMKTAAANREKEHEKNMEEVSEIEENIAVTDEAITALDEVEKGGALLQTESSSKQVLSHLSKKQIMRLQRLVVKSSKVSESDKQSLLAFLVGSSKAQGIGEVKGLLSTQKEEMDEEEKVVDKNEDKDVNVFQEMMAAKTTEKEAVEETLADKIDRLGSLKVSLVEIKGEISDAQNALSKDSDVLKKLDESCKAKTKEWDEREKTRAEELTAIEETIKILNDDDNLDLFKKALPSPSLLQLKATAEETRYKALSILRGFAMSKGSEAIANRTGVDLVMLALSGKGVDFSSVMKMIDNMVALMGQEQKDDDDKKTYCNKQSFENTKKTKALRHKIKTLEETVGTKEEALEAVDAEIKDLQAGVAELDKSVAESTDMRQKEHEEYQKLIPEQAATKEVLLLAKNRMNQFYHPELTTTFSTTGPYSLGFMQISEHQQLREEPPEFGKSKSQDGNSVLNMLQGLITETEKTVKEAEFSEKDSQRLYEDLLADAKAKRESDIKAIAGKKKIKAQTESEKVKKTASARAETEELKDVEQFGKSLNEECSWLLQNYEYRKTARAQERDTLVEAKGVLAGAQ